MLRELLRNPPLLRSRTMELARFLLTGALSVALNLVIIVFLTDYLQIHYLASIAICFAIVTPTGFWLNRTWTFRKREGRPAGEFVKYVVITTSQLVFGLLSVSFLVEVLHMRYTTAIILVPAVIAPMTYLLHRGWSFGLAWLTERT